MSLFSDEGELSSEKGGSQIRATGGKDKLPKTPDFTAWGQEPRKGSPFALSDFRSGAPVNTTKP